MSTPRTPEKVQHNILLIDWVAPPPGKELHPLSVVGLTNLASLVGLTDLANLVVLTNLALLDGLTNWANLVGPTNLANPNPNPKSGTHRSLLFSPTGKCSGALLIHSAHPESTISSR